MSTIFISDNTMNNTCNKRMSTILMSDNIMNNTYNKRMSTFDMSDDEMKILIKIRSKRELYVAKVVNSENKSFCSLWF